jgi:hypothetical protein
VNKVEEGRGDGGERKVRTKGSFMRSQEPKMNLPIRKSDMCQWVNKWTGHITSEKGGPCADPGVATPNRGVPLSNPEPTTTDHAPSGQTSEAAVSE